MREFDMYTCVSVCICVCLVASRGIYDRALALEFNKCYHLNYDIL